MTINHRAEAINLLAAAREDKNTTYEGHNPEADRLIAEAQVHATLARDEQQAATTADLRDALTLLRRREYAVRDRVSIHIAKALASKDRDRWQAGRNLARDLDEADSNMDREIDARLTDDGHDPKTAWNGSALPADDPWAPTPPPCVPGRKYSAPVETALRNLNSAGHVTPADTLKAAIPVIAGHIAEALTDGETEQVRTWARSIADELKRIGLNLDGAIESRVEDLNGGMPFSYDDEPPF